MTIFSDKNQRPQLLTILCILSFIGGGMGAVSNLFVFMYHGQIGEIIQQESFADYGFDMSIFTRIPKIYFLISGLLQIASLGGVRMMWNMMKTGFHVYAISQLLMLIVSTIFIYKPAGVFPMIDLLLATTFILLYLRFRDKMQ